MKALSLYALVILGLHVIGIDGPKLFLTYAVVHIEVVDQEWDDGASWRSGDVYLVTTRPPAVAGHEHNRRLPGVNHIALHGGSRAGVDRIVRESSDHGWSSLYSDRYPHAGGPQHYAAYLENDSGFKVEVVSAS